MGRLCDGEWSDGSERYDFLLCCFVASRKAGAISRGQFKSVDGQFQAGTRLSIVRGRFGGWLVGGGGLGFYLSLSST